MRWRSLLDRYGGENVCLFLDLIDELNSEELRLIAEGKLQDFSASAWIWKKLEEKLKGTSKDILEKIQLASNQGALAHDVD